MALLFDSKAWPRRTLAGQASALSAQQRLLAAGVVVDLEGAVRFTPEAELLCNSTPFKEHFPVHENALQSSPIIAAVRISGWMPDRVPRRMIGRICKHLDALTAARLYLSASRNEHDCTYKRQVMFSCCGPLAGSIWTSIPAQWEYFTSSHFVTASQKRLATVSVQDVFFSVN